MLKLLLFAITMILGFSGALIGIMVTFAVGDPIAGVLVGVPGLAIGAYSLHMVLRLNREYQDTHLAEVLADPSQIIARWQDERGEVIFAARGIFVGRSYYPFAAEYQALCGFSFDRESGRLVVTFDSIAPPPNSRPTLELLVAPEARGSVGEFADELDVKPDEKSQPGA